MAVARLGNGGQSYVKDNMVYIFLLIDHLEEKKE
jgi:hypothetical protein